MEFKLNDLSTLDEVLEVSKRIFNPTDNELEQYHNRSDWENKITNGGLLISVYEREECVGFAICFPHNDTTLHMWNVGVLDTHRRKGIWKQMYKFIFSEAKKSGYDSLTINTYKSKFPNMYRFVISEGFTESKIEEGKSFFRMSLSE